MTSRRLDIGAGRLSRWIDGFAQRHGPAAVTSAASDRIEIHARDGARVVLHVSFPADFTADCASGPDMGDDAELTPAVAARAVAENAAAQRDLAVILVRRGGYAVAVLTRGQVTASKVGSAYVQGRTAAGGWSQQRFARRRENQAQGLLSSAADVAVRLLTPVRAQFLVTGGDRDLVERLLADPRLSELAQLARGPHLEVGDPRKSDVESLPVRLKEVRVTRDEP